MTTLGILGTGLLGASIGLRVRELGWRVIGFDTDAQAAEEAAACGAIDLAVPRAEVLEQSDTIVIASHTGATIAELEAMRVEPPRAAKLIIDIASVKAPVVRAGRGLRNFVATHPMAGRERSGASAATRDLFEGKTWFYVPTGDRELDWCVVEFIGAFGATPVEVNAQEHDRIVAFTSHVPQVFATLFARSAEQRTGIDAYMGPAARDFLRLSRSNTHMWHDIIEANHTNIARELRLLAEQLARTADDIENARNLYEPLPR